MPFHVDRLWWLCAASAVGFVLAGCQRSGDKPETSQVVEAEPDAEQAPTAAATTPPSAEYFPTAVLETSSGKLTIKLDPQSAPRTVNNFLHYVESGFYDQTIFHQVEAGYVILGGGYTSELAEKPGRYPIPNEAANGRKNRRGTVAMARDPNAIDSSTCQFFINLSDNPHLDHRGDDPADFGYCVFGEVIDGLDVLDRIAAASVQATEHFEKLPVETVLIEAAYRLR